MIDIPAHIAGSIALLDKKAGFLFTGDEIEGGQVVGMRPDNIKAHMANMKELYDRYYDRISCIVPAHNGAPLAKRYIKYFMDLDSAIIAGTAPRAPIQDGPNFSFKTDEKTFRYRTNFAAIIYRAP